MGVINRHHTVRWFKYLAEIHPYDAHHMLDLACCAEVRAREAAFYMQSYPKEYKAFCAREKMIGTE